MIFRHKKGFTLIEGLVALMIFCILVVTFYKIFTQTTLHMADGKQRRAAVSLANERMEHYRNLAYANVGTTTNAPFGSIVADENVVINEMGFRIVTSVFYVDDPLDGRGSNSTDVIPNDYKRVGVSIIWDKCVDASYSRGIAEYGNECSGKRVHLISQFVPPGGLETIESGGILSINVLDENANAIANADITIVEGAHTTEVKTDATGNFMYIGAPACADCYKITVKKDGYGTISTKVSPAIQMTTAGDVSYYPRYINQSVTDGDMTSVAFIIKSVANLTVKTEDPLGDAVGNVDFSVRGGRVLGTNLNANPSYTDPDIYNLDDDTLVSNASGDTTIRTDTNDSGTITSDDDTNPGLFSFNLDEPGYTFWKMTPGVETNPKNITVDAGTTVAAKMIVVKNDYTSILVRVVDAEGVPVNDASVYMYDDNEPPIYDIMQKTDMYGYTYFPTRDVNEPHNIIPLEDNASYEITVIAAGFKDEVVTVETTKDKIKKPDDIILTKI